MTAARSKHKTVLRTGPFFILKQPKFTFKIQCCYNAVTCRLLAKKQKTFLELHGCKYKVRHLAILNPI